MREYTNGKKAVITKIVCNQCGKELKIENEIVLEDRLSVDKSWGYFSEKDGILHSFDLCEKCYDNLIKGFIIPVSKKNQRELL